MTELDRAFIASPNDNFSHFSALVTFNFVELGKKPLSEVNPGPGPLDPGIYRSRPVFEGKR